MARALKMLVHEFKTREDLVARDGAGCLRHFKVEHENGQIVEDFLSWAEACDLVAHVNDGLAFMAMFEEEPIEVSAH